MGFAAVGSLMESTSLVATESAVGAVRKMEFLADIKAAFSLRSIVPGDKSLTGIFFLFLSRPPGGGGDGLSPQRHNVKFLLCFCYTRAI